MSQQQKIFKLIKPPKEINGEETIRECCEQLGELYKYFKHEIIHNPTDIELRDGLKIVSDNHDHVINDPIYSKEMKEHFTNSFGWITIAYNILSDKSLRSIYNEKFLKKYIELEQPIQEINRYLGALVYVLNLPFKTISYQISKPNNRLSTFEIGKSIYNSRGLGGFIGGTFFSLAVDTVYSFIDSCMLPIFGFSINNPNRSLLSTLYIIFIAFTRIPCNFIIDLIYCAPFSMSTFEIIKNILFRDGIGGNSYKFSNIYYSFIWNFIIYLVVYKIILFSNSIVFKAQLKSKENPNSMIYKFLSSPIATALIQASMLWPVLMIRYQYANDFVQSFLTNSSLPVSVNPISIAIRMYNQNGIKKFYDGFLTCGFPFYLLTNNYSKHLSTIK
ncbi:hypothetical protein ACTFIU_002543 [Dictyostelium citrinum]